MIDRRLILAVGGSFVGIVGGTAAAVNGAPVPGIIAAIGAVAAGIGNLLVPGGPAAGPAAPAATASPTAGPGATPSTHFSASTVDAPSDGDPADPAESLPPIPAPSPPAPAHTPSERIPLLTDPGTGLFSEDYFDIAIDARLAAARRHLRPVGVVLLEVVEGMRVDNIRPTDPTHVADAVRATLREADTACRREDGRFALLLEDTPENGAIWTVERIRRHLVDQDASLTVWAGVACYPAHAFDSESLMIAAELALDAAREWRQDRIEVAAGE